MDATSFADMNRDQSEEPQPEEVEFAEPKLVKPLPSRASPVASTSQEQDEEQGEDDEDNDDEDAEDSDEQPDKPKRKKAKRRKRGGNQFIDIEAEIDEDDDDDEDAEDGFVPGDEFISDRPERRQAPGSGMEAMLGNDGNENEEFESGDASHRMLDRRINAAADRKAREEAAGFRTRHGKSNYNGDGADEWAPKALLMPGVNDPSVWGVKCKTGRERELIMSLSRKALAMSVADNGVPLKIISAFQRDSIKGFIYVEARSEQAVREAVNNLIGIYSGSASGVFLVDIEEMPDLLRTKQKKIPVLVGGWVRIKRGKFAGDLAQIIALSENGEEVTLKQIPRIDLTPKDDGLQVGSDGKKRKKGAGVPIAFRPPQRFFNPEEIRKIYGNKEVQRKGGALMFRGDEYREGYLEKESKLNAMIFEDVQPSIDELTRFLGESKTQAGGHDLTAIAELNRKNAKTILQPGDSVEVYEGDQKGMWGIVHSILNDVVSIIPSATLDLGGTRVEIQARSVRKKFKAGDHVKVMNGSNMDETGLVVKIQEEVITFLSDLSLQEVTVFVKDVREAAEVGSGVNVIGQYELHDLVQLDTSTTGVIFKIERDMFRILDQMGAVRSLNPSQIGIKADSRRAVATDMDGYNIEKDDMMKESGANNITGGRQGRVLHVYRSQFAFLYNRELTENGGVFVAYARSLVSTAPKGNTGKPTANQGLNPDRFPQQQQQVDGGIAGRPRRDGRIDRRVLLTKGAWKGYSAFVKDVTGMTARVELHTNSKVITINLMSLKEQLPDGSLIELQERRGGDFGGSRPAHFNREDSSFSSASNTAPLGQSGAMGGRTPMPSYGGRTPAPQFSSGRTPAPNYSGGRTPAPGTSSWNAGGATPAWNANSSASSSAWATGSKTPGRPAIANAWDSNSATPAYRTQYNDGGATPNPNRNADPYGKSSYNRKDTAPTPAANPYEYDYPSHKSVETPFNGAPTPGPSYSAPTPAAYQSSYSAPTPAAYPSAPYGSAPTPYSAPTPFASAATPGAGYSQTPAAGAPTPAWNRSAATPAVGTVGPGVQDYEPKRAERLAKDWAIPGLRVRFQESTYQNNRLVQQTGIVQVDESGRGELTVRLDSNQELITDITLAIVMPIQPTRPGDPCYVLNEKDFGKRGATVSQDGSEWMVALVDGHTRLVIDSTFLGIAS